MPFKLKLGFWGIFAVRLRLYRVWMIMGICTGWEGRWGRWRVRWSLGLGCSISIVWGCAWPEWGGCWFVRMLGWGSGLKGFILGEGYWPLLRHFLEAYSVDRLSLLIPIKTGNSSLFLLNFTLFLHFFRWVSRDATKTAWTWGKSRKYRF